MLMEVYLAVQYGPLILYEVHEFVDRSGQTRFSLCFEFVVYSYQTHDSGHL